MEAGSRLGPYEIVARIGAGGMGEVWRARDTRLGRDVAIKILPSEFAQDARLKIRFEREAKTISRLSHPNICTLFDVGENYIVMELLEGEALAARLVRGPLSIPEVIRYGVQIAEALGKAHREGVIHRDLKPGNVMITKSGAKLLDFGLAKSTRVEAESRDVTAHKPITEQCAVIWTLQYMAPEQLAGEEPDARTDIFALGAVLYEMATGKRAFEGKNRTSLVGAIVSGEPRAIRELQPLTPPALEHVIMKCLEKEPDDRWQNASDIAEELRWISQAGSQAGLAPVIPRKRGRRILVATAALGWLLAIGALLTTAIHARRSARTDRVTRTEIIAPLGETYHAPLSLSPDGRRIAAVVREGTENQLWLRDLATTDGRLLNGTEGATFPFWSPDGRAVGFFANGKLKTINLDNGAVQSVCDASRGRGGAWSRSGIILFAPDFATPLFKVSENGGTPSAVTKTRGPTEGHRNPHFLPDGRHFVYSAGDRSHSGKSSLFVGVLDGSLRRKLLDRGSNAAFADGWLLTVRDRNLVAQRFDPRTLELTGQTIPIVQGVGWYTPRATGTFAIAGDTLVYRLKQRPKARVVRATTAGVGVLGEIGEYETIAASPDGRRVALNRYDDKTGGYNLWIMSLENGSLARATFETDGRSRPVSAFSPDGQKLFIANNVRVNGTIKAWIQKYEGGPPEVLFESSDPIAGPHWVREAKSLLFSAQRVSTGHDIELMSLDERKQVPLLQTNANEQHPRLSPDGRWVAYASDETGRFEIYATDFPAASAKWQVSQEGGTHPRWSADGSRLYFLSRPGMFVVKVLAGATFSVGPPVAFSTLGDGVTDFDIANDGTMVALQEVDKDEQPIKVTLNWQTLLEDR